MVAGPRRSLAPAVVALTDIGNPSRPRSGSLSSGPDSSRPSGVAPPLRPVLQTETPPLSEALDSPPSERRCLEPVSSPTGHRPVETLGDSDTIEGYESPCVERVAQVDVEVPVEAPALL